MGVAEPADRPFHLAPARELWGAMAALDGRCRWASRSPPAGSIRAPTLIVVGDRDIVPPEHAAELARLIPGARLLVLPGGHGDYLGEVVAASADTRQPKLTAQLIEQFLDDPSR
jgi:pimeloyl-ACP methyl ester carboxylesterase